MLYAYLTCLLLCCLLAISQWKYLVGNFRWLSVLVVITTIVEAVGLVLMLKRITSFPLFHAYQPIEYGLFALFFRDTLHNTLYRRFINFSIIAFSLFCLINAFFIQTWRAPNSYSFMIEAILLVVLSALYFQQLLREPVLSSMRRIPEFWVVTGVLFFFTGSFFVVGLINYFIQQNSLLAIQLYTINHVLNIIFYGLYTTGLVWKAQLMKSSLS